MNAETAATARYYVRERHVPDPFRLITEQAVMMSHDDDTEDQVLLWLPPSEAAMIVEVLREAYSTGWWAGGREATYELATKVDYEKLKEAFPAVEEVFEFWNTP